MNTYKNIQSSYLNRSLAIANLYHEQNNELSEQNKQVIELYKENNILINKLLNIKTFNL